MSAFVVNREHVDILVALGIGGPSDVTAEQRTWHGPRWFAHDPAEVPSPTVRELLGYDCDERPHQATPSGDEFAASRGPDGVVGQDADHLEAIRDVKDAAAEGGES